MRKFLVTFLGCIVFSYVGYAADFKANENGDCAVWKRDMAANQFWFCSKSDGTVRGEKGDSCNGEKVRKGSKVTQLSNNEVLEDFRPDFTHTHYTILCCDGKIKIHTAEKAAPEVFSDITSDEHPNLVKDLGNGASCTRTLNKCGDIVTDCDKASSCSPVPNPESTDSSTITPQLREGKCVLPCSGVDRAFKDELSSECVDCPTTRLQGIDSSRTCKYCLEGREFWVPAQGRCVSRSGMQNYSGTLLEKCFMCSPSTNIIKDCMACIKGDSVVCTDTVKSEVLKDCNLDSTYQLIRN